jgi:hypothetical protein
MNLSLLLSATLLALLSGPLLYGAARERPAVLAFLDGFVLVAISGLVTLEVLPETLDSGGYASLVFLVLGALGPSLLENQLHNAQARASRAALYAGDGRPGAAQHRRRHRAGAATRRRRRGRAATSRSRWRSPYTACRSG